MGSPQLTRHKAEHIGSVVLPTVRLAVFTGSLLYAPRFPSYAILMEGNKTILAVSSADFSPLWLELIEDEAMHLSSCLLTANS